MKKVLLITLWILTAAFVSAQTQSFKPGEPWPDNNGIHINAHGGGILYYAGTYYWFGEFKTAGRGGNTTQVGIRCYSSKDLYQWKNEGIVMPVERFYIRDRKRMRNRTTEGRVQ